MSIRYANYTINGISPLLQNNPQTVDRFNRYSRAMAVINKKGQRRTDDDFEAIRDLEIRAKIYWDDDQGIYVPTTWVHAALCQISFTQAKISKANMRGAVFMAEPTSKLKYRSIGKVKGVDDIVKNGEFRHLMLLKQGQVRVAKAVPIFHDWSFSGGIEFDDKVIDPDTISQLLHHAAHYGGFGDFRPTFGRAQVEVNHD